MGSKPAPDYANIFMAEFDQKILELAISKFPQSLKIKFYRRFLDDIFIIFNATTSTVHKFMDAVNQISDSIKFTIEHTTPYNIQCEDCEKCNCETSCSIPFLDTLCSIKNGKIITDLYRKPTDRNMYLLTSSCHPAHVTTNIPFSLALRIIRICSEPESRDQRLSELKQLLLDRGYKAKIVDAAISKAKQIPRNEALKKVVKNKTSDRPVFVATFDRRWPSFSNIVNKHWRALTTNPHMATIFPKPPLIAYKRPQTIKDKLIRARVPSPPSRPKRVLNGMIKCNKPCSICPFIKVQKAVKSTSNSKVVDLHKHHTCEDKNICYILECKKCRMQYIGETDRTLKDGYLEHRGYIRREKLEKSTGHDISDMSISVLERIYSTDPLYRKIRESYYIEQFESLTKGINRKR